eukprot:SAG11_NODE_925_length_6524_cov_3.379300_3_plen_48_part_00
MDQTHDVTCASHFALLDAGLRLWDMYRLGAMGDFVRLLLSQCTASYV